MRQILLLTIVIGITASAFGQQHRLKGDGQIFWEEHFDWEDASNPRGWSLPEGWQIEDNSWDDTGFVWVWTKDSLQGPFSRRDGGYILNSETRENGFLAIDMDLNNAYVNYMEMKQVNSTITLPVMDCSTHPSVILELQQLFKYMNTPRMVIEVSNDNGAHWAEFDMKMGTSSMINTMNLKNTQVAHYMANLSDVAAGQPQVTIRITWEGSILYFWMLDDLVLREGWDYDLKMNHWQVSLQDERTNDHAGFFYMMPKTQILPIGGFEASATNYGDLDLNNVYFNVTINKNGQEQFNASTQKVRYLFFGDPADTMAIEQTYTPVDFGHYELVMGMYSDDAEQVPENNIEKFFFHVTDSVFARTPDVSEADESPWRSYYQYTHEGDYMGVEFNPVTDVEASSVSVYIARANLDADFAVALLEITEEGGEETIVELLSSETMRVDSTILKNGWITIPLEKDGVGEFMKAGKRYIAAVQFWTYITEDNLINRGNTFWIGSTRSYPGSFDKQWWFSSYENNWTQGSSYNKMIRLNINNHDNRIDGIELAESSLMLGQNYPNPAQHSTTIPYSLDQTGDVILRISDLTGRKVLEETFKNQPAGEHQVNLDLSKLESGVYSYSLTAGGLTQFRKLVKK